jgi:soluble lytic murein transglycosylase-like protein
LIFAVPILLFAIRHPVRKPCIAARSATLAPGHKEKTMMKLPLLLLLASTLCSPLAQADIYSRIDADGVARFSPVPSEGFTLYFHDPAGAGAPVAAPAAAGTQAQLTWDDDTPYASQVRAAAKSTNVDPALIRAVISVESGNNPAARSPAGAVGLMQLMPGTAKRYNVKNRLDPTQNIQGGASYLRDLLVMFNNNLQLVLAAYNAGEQAVLKYGNRIPPFRETTAYVPKVLAYYKKFSGMNTVDAATAAPAGDWRAHLPQARVRQSFMPTITPVIPVHESVVAELE